MPIEIVVALIGVVGSALGTFAGILATSKLTTYRLEQLEKRWTNTTMWLNVPFC